jgi:hypothetical protein
MLGEGYLILSRHLVHDITKYWPSDMRGGKFVVLDVLRDQPKGRWMNMTTLFPTMSIIYRWNRKLVISTIISYLIHVHRVFNHLTRLFGFSLRKWVMSDHFGNSLLTLIFYPFLTPSLPPSSYIIHQPDLAPTEGLQQPFPPASTNNYDDTTTSPHRTTGVLHFNDS